MCDVVHATLATKITYGCPIDIQYEHDPSLVPQMKDYMQTEPLKAKLAYDKDPDSQRDLIIEKNWQREWQKFYHQQQQNKNQ